MMSKNMSRRGFVKASAVAGASAMLAAFGLAAAMPAQAADNELMMATTTSTQDSGLLEFLEPTFKQETRILRQFLSERDRIVVIGTVRGRDHLHA